MNNDNTALQDLEYWIGRIYQPEYNFTDEEMGDVTARAFAGMRERFRDFDLLIPEIYKLALALPVNGGQMVPEDYLESLYLVVRNSSFMEAARNALMNDETQHQALEAIARVRAKHADFDPLWPSMQRLSKIISVDWNRCTFDLRRR
jgi:hypothetical protein